MSMPPGFSTHHKAAKRAFDQGDHAKALHHIGHLMVTVKRAQKGQNALALQPQDQMNQAPEPDAPPVMRTSGLGNWMGGQPSPRTMPDALSQLDPMASKRAAFAKMKK